jgi:predicted nucleic acid-binding protein
VTDCVLDASALVLALIGRTDPAAVLRARLPGLRRHAPHLIDAEAGNVLRRHRRAALITDDEAHTALRAGQLLVELRYPHTGPLAELAWTLRDRLSFYDALYVALAATLRAPLLTCDTRLARAADLPCAVETV